MTFLSTYGELVHDKQKMGFFPLVCEWLATDIGALACFQSICFVDKRIHLSLVTPERTIIYILQKIHNQ